MQIIESYREQEAIQLYNNGRMLDFLPIISPDSAEDLQILETWAQHFRNQKVPFIVLNESKRGRTGKIAEVYVLYKERRAV